MKRIIVDSGFLIALYDDRDGWHDSAVDMFVQYFGQFQNILVITWPILYESISTRMVKNNNRLHGLYRDWKKMDEKKVLEYLDDNPFREKALHGVFEELNRDAGHYRTLSLTDRVIRGILDEPEIKVDYLITSNPRDFSDICSKRRIQLIDL